MLLNHRRIEIEKRQEPQRRKIKKNYFLYQLQNLFFRTFLKSSARNLRMNFNSFYLDVPFLEIFLM